MIRYLAKRVTHAVVVLWAAFTVSFFVMNLAPGDPVIAIIGAQNLASTPPSEIAELRRQFGINKPLIEQYWTQLGHALQGNLGTSYSTRQPVSSMLAGALPNTLALASSALVLGLVAGVTLAVLANFTTARWVRSALMALPPLGASVPTFWSGLVLLEIFSFRFPVFPASSGDGFSSLVLPAVTLAIPIAALVAQVLSETLAETLAEPYVQVIRAKGATRTRILLGHALRNASIPVLTIVGILVATVLGGSVIVETVFSRNGIGQIAASAVTSKDIPVVQGVVILAATAYVVVSLLVDLVYPLVDPRIRLWASR
ncbi:MAG: ABC transporter permease [Streptosporangiaceae bacterium]|jgi:peptide/nickel transport system permease protein